MGQHPDDAPMERTAIAALERIAQSSEKSAQALQLLLVDSKLSTLIREAQQLAERIAPHVYEAPASLRGPLVELCEMLGAQVPPAQYEGHPTENGGQVLPFAPMER